jgi:hypothetical protein
VTRDLIISTMGCAPVVKDEAVALESGRDKAGAKRDEARHWWLGNGNELHTHASSYIPRSNCHCWPATPAHPCRNTVSLSSSRQRSEPNVHGQNCMMHATQETDRDELVVLMWR